MLQITEQLRDVLVKYLSLRPYQEVAQGIAELSQLKKVVEIKTPTENKPVETLTD